MPRTSNEIRAEIAALEAEPRTGEHKDRVRAAILKGLHDDLRRAESPPRAIRKTETNPRRAPY